MLINDDEDPKADDYHYICEWFHSKLFTKSILKLMSKPKDEDKEELIECVKSPTRLDSNSKFANISLN